MSLSAASGQTVTVSYATADGTATTADADWRVWRNSAGGISLPADANIYLSTSGEVLPILTPRTWMRVCSGARGARVNQGAERIITLFGRRWS